MTTQLGTLADLPLEYQQTLTDHNLLPLWPGLRNVLPYDIPSRATQPTLWRYEDIRPNLLRAGELTPIEKAERRVLVMANPGLGLERMMATPTIYLGMQLILPGETAPNHRHTPSAIRFVVEGEGGFTMVEGEHCPMEKGDLILTPAGLWHEHGHTGDGPVVWLDALDLPLIYSLEASYCIEGDSHPQSNKLDSSQTRYRRSGLVPYDTLNKPRSDYPLVRYPWADVREALLCYEKDADLTDPVQLAYVNPETGRECLPILGFSALMLRGGETRSLRRRSASAVFHVIEGEGEIKIDGTEFRWSEGDTVAIPTHAEVTLQNRAGPTPAFLFMVDDAPMQRKLGFYEEF